MYPCIFAMMKSSRAFPLVLPLALIFGISIIVARFEILHGSARLAFYWALAPALPACALAVVLLRHARNLDELERRLHLDALAIALAVLAISIVVVGLLQRAHIVGVDATLWLFLAGVGAYLAGYWFTRRMFA
jgi:hypothetical protein